MKLELPRAIMLLTHGLLQLIVASIIWIEK